MPIVVLEKIATGVAVAKKKLAKSLVNVHRVVVFDEAGRPRHLEGGEATIWVAGHNGEFAIKVFKEAAEGRAEPEFEKLQSLQQSRYVPRVYAFGKLVEDDNVAHPAIVEEYVRGTSLAEAIAGGLITGNAREQYLDATTTASIALELTRGLRDLSGAGLAHRDISCSNVLLDNKCVHKGLAGEVRVRLVDFGTSTNVDRADATVLGDGVRLTTIPYGAPEMFGGDHYEEIRVSDDLKVPGRNSSTTDVWSIGAIIVFLMWGEYWPSELSDIQQRQQRGELIVGLSDASRIARAKESPIDLVSLIQKKRTVTPRDREMAEIVRGCTEYEPILRLHFDQIEYRLLKVIENQGEIKADSNSSISPDTPVLRMASTQESSKGLLGITLPSESGRTNTTNDRALSDSKAGLDIGGEVKPGSPTLFADESGMRMNATEPKNALRHPKESGVTTRSDRYASLEPTPKHLINVVRDVLVGCHPSLIDLVVCNGVKEIGETAFVGHTALKSVVLPKSVKNISSGAFQDCTSLESIFMPGVRKIGSNAFKNCTALNYAAMPTVRRIYGAAFEGCTSLNAVVPDKANVSISAFDGCYSARRASSSVNTSMGLSVWEGRLIRYLGKDDYVFLPDDITSLGNSVFAGLASLETVNMPAVIEIGCSSFANCTSLQRVHAPAVREIGPFAFNHCSSLQRVEFPSATNIEIGAFFWCTSLGTIKMPEARKIGHDAFWECLSLASVDMPVVRIIGSNSFRDCGLLRDISIPSVEKVGKEAFIRCKSITVIGLPTVLQICDNAFAYCTSLEKAVLPASASIGINSFPYSTEIIQFNHKSHHDDITPVTESEKSLPILTLIIVISICVALPIYEVGMLILEVLS